MVAYRSDTDLSGTVHSSESTNHLGGDNSFDHAGAAVRMEPAANTYYAGGISVAASQPYIIFEVTNNLRATLGTAGSVADLDALCKTHANASTISLDIDGVEKISVTDTSLTSKRVGIAGLKNTNGDGLEWDGYTGEDEGVVVTFTPRVMVY